MSAVGKRLEEAIAKVAAKDLENALIQVSIAIDISGKKKWPKKKVGERFKDFIREHESLIFFMTIGIKGEAKPMFSFPGANGERYDIAHVYYKAVRNGLLHDGEISENLKIVEDNVFMWVDGKITISKMILMALILAVVCDPVNANEKFGKRHVITFSDGAVIKLHEMWGNKENLYNLIGHNNI